MSAINCSHVVAKKMIKENVKGSIVNVSSVAGITTFPKNFPYGASKAAKRLLYNYNRKIL